ncbi:MAG: NF038143 family protein [Bacillota bacterium]|jgi:hypothetical protein
MAEQGQIIKDEKYESIFAYESKTAQIIASKVMDRPELSPWMILIPIVFIPFLQRYQKYKDSCKVFRDGFLYTKTIALDIAYKVYRNDLPQEGVSELVSKIVQKNSNVVPEVLNIYQKQIQEIKLLCQHYLALLNTEKVQYKDMVVCYYQNESKYRDFLYKLTEAENEVNSAVNATFKEGLIDVPGIMEKMEKYLLQFRLDEAKKFFN